MKTEKKIYDWSTNPKHPPTASALMLGIHLTTVAATVTTCCGFYRAQKYDKLQPSAAAAAPQL